MSDASTLIPSLIILTKIPAVDIKFRNCRFPPPRFSACPVSYQYDCIHKAHSATNGVGEFTPGGGGLISPPSKPRFLPCPGLPFAIPGFTHRGHPLAVMFNIRPEEQWRQPCLHHKNQTPSRDSKHPCTDGPSSHFISRPSTSLLATCRPAFSSSPSTEELPKRPPHSSSRITSRVPP